MRQSAPSQPPDGGRLGLAVTPLPSLNMAADAGRVRRRLAANSAVRLLLMVGVAIGALLGFAAGVAIGWFPAGALLGPSAAGFIGPVPATPWLACLRSACPTRARAMKSAEYILTFFAGALQRVVRSATHQSSGETRPYLGISAKFGLSIRHAHCRHRLQRRSRQKHRSSATAP